MKKMLLLLLITQLQMQLPAQNLVTNPDAENLPRGTGWTVVSQGSLACLSAPTDNWINWTMKPDGSANYPFDHTSGANGGTVFFSGCSSYFGGPFELQQTIDVSSDATSIDAGNQAYTFSGYIQTPVNNQTDQGRFIVDYQNAAGVILGSSYASNWQSYFGGSGTGWVNYTNTRIAPVNTRKITIRMLTQITFNQPAINVYFDDIALSKPFVVPVGLTGFSATEHQETVSLNWTFTTPNNIEEINLERSDDAVHFTSIAVFPEVIFAGYFNDKINNSPGGTHYYRLKITGNTGVISYSNTVSVKHNTDDLISLFPNPASSWVMLKTSVRKGMASVINSNGQTVLLVNTSGIDTGLDVSGLAPGIYLVRFHNRLNDLKKILVIRRQ